MNNRIMAMLFALVAAMFISIVPVKAEAAVANHNHVVTLIAEKPATCAEDGMQAHYKCNTCDYKEDLAHKQVTSAQLTISKNTVEHTYEWAYNDAYHYQRCTNEKCTEFRASAAHNKDCSVNENGGHTWSCKDENCGWTETEEHNPNANCVCQSCDEVLHALTLVPAKDATCAEEGNKAYYVCEDCGAKFLADTMEQVTSDKLVIAKLTTHAYEWVYNDTHHYQKCTFDKCTATRLSGTHNKDCSANEEGGHTWSCKTEGCEWTVTEDHADKATDPSDFCVCDICDADLEHDLGNWVKDIDGHKKVCKKCGDAVNEGEHNYGEAKAVEGHTYHVKVCNDCGFERQFNCTSADKDCLCDECGTMVKHTAADMETVGRVEATCEKDGNIGYNKCKTCGKAFSVNGEKYTLYTGEIVIPKLGHKFDATWNWHENEDGTAHYKYCANGCNTHVYGTAEDVKVGEQAHTHGGWNKSDDAHEDVCAVCEQTYGYEKHNYTKVEKAAASSTGTQRHKVICECGAYELKKCVFDENCVCKNCGDEKVHVAGDVQFYSGKDATCTATGLETYARCKTCDAYFLTGTGKLVPTTKDGIVIPALGHKWEPNATMDEVEGRHIMKCANPGCTKGTVMNHYTNDGDCFCDVAGCNVIAHSHKLVFVAGKDATCTEAGTEAYYKYEGCGKMFDLYQNPITATKVIEPTGHDFGDEWIPCEDGIHAKFCANCDEFLSEEHSFQNGNVQCSVCGGEEELTHVAAKAANCVENGNVEYWYSKVTGKMYADAAGSRELTNVTVKATGHNMSGWQDMGNGLGHEQVCMNDGCDHTLTGNHNNVNGCFCTECGGFKSGHAMEMVDAIPATCAKAGTQAHFKCSCGKLYDLGYNQIEAPKAIAQLKHVMNTEVKKDVKEGKHYIQCKSCDYRMYEEHGMELSDPLKGNYHQWLCECGELEIETHYDKNGDNKCDVCDHSMNGTSVTVEQHDNKTVYTGDKDTVKPTKSWWENWLETLTPSNSGGTTASTEKAPAANTGSSSAPAGNASGSNTGSTGNTNTGSTNSGNANTGSGSASTGNASGSNTGSTPTVSQTNVIVQFINWLFGLFGF